MNRLVIVPEESHEALGAELRPRLAAVAREIRAGNLTQVLGAQALGLLTHFSSADLQLWAEEDKGYGIAWESVSRAVPLTGRARADAGEGMVARIFESGRSETAGSDELELAEWCNLPQLLTTPVAEMSASPVHVFGKCVAAVTSIREEPGESPLPAPSEIASLLSLLIGDRLVRMSLGLDSA
jgi:hypothetical protein